MRSSTEPTRAAIAVPALRTLLVQPAGFGHERVRTTLEAEPDLQLVTECASCSDAVRHLDHLDPDLIVLDLDLPSGGAGELLHRLTEHAGALIVLAASPDRAWAAFEAHAVDFVVKPLRDDRLQAAVERARIWLRGRDASDGGEAVNSSGASSVPNAPNFPGGLLFPRSPLSAAVSAGADLERHYLVRLAIRVDERVLFVRVVDVDFFEGSGNYVKVHVGEQHYRLRVSLRELAQRLEPRRFRRIHRSSLVNLDRIKEVQPWFGGDYVVILRDGRQLRASRTYAPDLLKPLQ